MKTNLIIEGMSCGHCVRAVENALRHQPGVSEASVSLERHAAEVTHDDSITDASLIAAVVAEGYDARVNTGSD